MPWRQTLSPVVENETRSVMERLVDGFYKNTDQNKRARRRIGDILNAFSSSLEQRAHPQRVQRMQEFFNLYMDTKMEEARNNPNMQYQ